jgi:outer membrane protein assembly factor BamD (BamD/ComL family)
MKKIYIVSLLALTVVAGCNSRQEKLSASIRELCAAAVDTVNLTVNKDKALGAMNACKEYAGLFPTDSLSAPYLLIAAEMAMRLQKPQEAVDLYAQVFRNYPGYAKASQCLFMQAFIYENDLHDLDKAKELYTDFITRYPNDEFADDARACLRYLGKSPEELIREFESLSKGQDTLKPATLP